MVDTRAASHPAAIYLFLAPYENLSAKLAALLQDGQVPEGDDDWLANKKQTVKLSAGGLG